MEKKLLCQKKATHLNIKHKKNKTAFFGITLKLTST